MHRRHYDIDPKKLSAAVATQEIVADQDGPLKSQKLEWSPERIKDFERATTDLCGNLQDLMTRYNGLRFERSKIDVNDNDFLVKSKSFETQMRDLQAQMEALTQEFINSQVQEDLPRSVVVLISEHFQAIQPVNDTVIYDLFLMIINQLFKIKSEARIASYLHPSPSQ